MHFSMTGKYVVGIASGLSGVAIAVALLSAFIIVQDINSLYDQIMDDMVEFKGLANDAWVGMVEHTRHERAAGFQRARRQGYGETGGSAASSGGGSSAGGYGGGSSGAVGGGSGSQASHGGSSSCPAGPPVSF